MRLPLVFRREAPLRRGRRSIAIGLKMHAIPLHAGELHLIPRSQTLGKAERWGWGLRFSTDMFVA